MSPSVKLYLHWIGNFLAASGCVFVVLRLKDYSSDFDLSRFDSCAWLAFLLLALLYGLANFMLALAWRNLLAYFGVEVYRLWATRIYGLTQLAKYVPGNIMHLAGRQVMGLSAGISGRALVKVSIWELGLFSITGFFFIIIVIPHFFPVVNIYTAIASFLSALLLMGVGLGWLLGLNILRAFEYYVTFLIISGLIFTGVLSLVAGTSSLTVLIALMFSSSYVVAWLIGLITPGAPGGIGVREAILVVLLKGVAPEADLLLAVLLSRVVTVSGDVIFFLLASLIPSN